MKRYRRTAASQYLVVVLVLAAIVGFGWLSVDLMSRVPFTDHFAIPWAAGRTWLLEGGSPYGPTVAEMGAAAIEESTYLANLPESPEFSQPLLSLLLYLPFSLIPYSVSRVIWMTVIGLCLGFIGFLGIRLSGWKLSTLETFGAIVVLIFWLPGIVAIIGGHLSPLIIALILMGVYLMINGQDTTAGFILSLTFSSFPTSGLILIVILIWCISQKRWSILTGFFSGVIFLIVVSWLVLPSWFLDWASILINTYQGWDWINTPVMLLANLLPGIADSLSIFLHAVLMIYVIALIITIMGKSGRVFSYKFFVVLVLAYLLHIQGAINYLFFLIPGMFLVFRFWSERWPLTGRLLSWFLLILLGVGSWLLVYPQIDFTTLVDSPMLSIGYPIIVLFSLVYIRWWALTIPKLPYETL